MTIKEHLDGTDTVYLPRTGDHQMNQQQLDDLMQYADDDIREKIHGDLAPCDPQRFWEAYTEAVGDDDANMLLDLAGYGLCDHCGYPSPITEMHWFGVGGEIGGGMVLLCYACLKADNEARSLLAEPSS